MYKGHNVAVVVPAYNESGLVGTVIDTMPDFVDRVYAVDDCSSDDTWIEICHHAALANSTAPGLEHITDGGYREARVVPIRHRENTGVGGAVKTGYRYALEDNMDVIAVMNGDAQMDPAVLSRMLDPIVDGDADYAKGDRLRMGVRKHGMSRWRLFGNSLLTLLNKLSSGYWQTNDSQNGYTAISRRALERIPYEELYDQYGFLNDMLTTLNLHNLRVANVPHNAVYGDEQSTIRYGTFIPTLSAILLRNFVRRLTVRYLMFGFHPTILCYALGVAGLLLGVLATVLLLVGVSSIELTVVGGIVTAFMLLFSGAVLAAAMVLDAQQSEPLEVMVRE